MISIGMNNLKPLTRTLAILLLPILLGMVAFNIRLYYQPRFVTIGDSQINKGQLPPGGELYREATGEIDWTWSELSSDEAKEPFEKGLAPPYGIFYRGWTNYVLGRTLKLLPEERRDTLKVDQFRRNCADIVAAWKERGTPFPESYSQG